MNPKQRRLMTGYVAAGIGFYVLLAFTAYYGGQLVFGYGAAVSGVAGDPVLSIHDLNTLAVRQTDENLKYSEMMHPIFRWMTLALSGSLLAQSIAPDKSRVLRRVGPALLLAGRLFLFFCADLDLSRLTDPRQWGDREVELHKTIAVILRRRAGAGRLSPPVAPAMASLFITVLGFDLADRLADADDVRPTLDPLQIQPVWRGGEPGDAAVTGF